MESSHHYSGHPLVVSAMSQTRAFLTVLFCMSAFLEIDLHSEHQHRVNQEISSICSKDTPHALPQHNLFRWGKESSSPVTSVNLLGAVSVHWKLFFQATNQAKVKCQLRGFDLTPNRGTQLLDDTFMHSDVSFLWTVLSEVNIFLITVSMHDSCEMHWGRVCVLSQQWGWQISSKNILLFSLIRQQVLGSLPWLTNAKRANTSQVFVEFAVCCSVWCAVSSSAVSSWQKSASHKTCSHAMVLLPGE